MKKRSRETALPDMTPMIDVVFLLLIFFMVSTVFKKDELALILSLPKSETGEEKTQETPDKYLYIELSPEKLAYNGKKMLLSELPAKLKTIKKKSLPVELRIDKEVKYERMVRLIDVIKKAQLLNISLITDH